MVRVLNYTPSWLSRLSPDANIFANTAPRSPARPSNGTKKAGAAAVPLKKVAYRGTQIFVAVGNEVRWTDLQRLKDEHQAKARRRLSRPRGHSVSDDDEDDEEDYSYTILKPNFDGEILQLIISPNQDYLAMVTAATVHIATIPETSQLQKSDRGPYRLKTFQLGPTIHVIEKPAVASLLWHPLGHMGCCIVTVTVDAVVRLWEVSREDRWSFDTPSLTINLPALIDASTSEDAMRASVNNANTGFSPDDVDMKVASTCFGTSDPSFGHAWSATTLWIAMANGCVYSLCPCLPTKWEAPPGFFKAVSTYVSAEMSPNDSKKEENLQLDLLHQWFTELEGQEPIKVSGRPGYPSAEVFYRPVQPGPIPKLQGPFIPEPDIMGDCEVSDLVVTALTKPRDLDLHDSLYASAAEEEVQCLSSNILSLLTTDGKVYNCLNLTGVTAAWLPFTSEANDSDDEPDADALLNFEVITLHDTEHLFKASFSPDPFSPFTYFVTDLNGVYSLSLSSTVDTFIDEIEDPLSERLSLRLEQWFQRAKSIVDHVLPFPEAVARTNISACITLSDSEIGYFLLTAANGQPFAANLDIPSDILETDVANASGYDIEDLNLGALVLAEPRHPFMPSDRLVEDPGLLSFVENVIPQRHRRRYENEVRLGPETLAIMTDIHRYLAEETIGINDAVSDLFTRCERLLGEFRDQLQKTKELVRKIDAVTGEDDDDFQTDEAGEALLADEKLREKFARTTERQRELVAQHERLKQKLARLGGLELSEKEKAWVREVYQVAGAIEGGEVEGGKKGKSVVGRVKEVAGLKEELRGRVEAVVRVGEGKKGVEGTGGGAPKVPTGYRKARMGQVMEMLARQESLVEATGGRLERLRDVVR
ncbi:hypothetical protein P152DRAFT_511247 [Eremomyces bilateralis CBS 781.70]|uniref:Nuclear pore complex protein An-Nup82 n=1 Tax=Eremomyces bilateralis CBS 781.70 TaxID=1392243 RepID=A0A6G1GF26_9PEZI|nr:uncharacterized protein P152DRAFT_511247 [Eremomyces bilateralis CBS 781.70]KAF1816479.1 hypothetical protein P152DRAFT_511247 [Eremomyces bilateralis CBS 781.70]